MILNYNICFLDAIFRKALFVHLKRDPVTNVASILEARRRQHGSEKAWYSFKIPEYPRLKDLSPVAQAAGQVHYINRGVTRGLAKVAAARKLVVEYEAFCLSPHTVFDELVRKLGISQVSGYVGPSQFRSNREVDVAQRAAIEDALTEFERQPG